MTFSNTAQPYLRKELDLLPGAVRRMALILLEQGMELSSVVSDYVGQPRTSNNGPTHMAKRAVDLVVGPTPPSYAVGLHSKPRFIANLGRHLRPHGISCAVIVESDHVHLDDMHPPGIYIYTSTSSVDHSCNTTSTLQPLLTLLISAQGRLISGDFSYIMLDILEAPL